VAGNSEVPAKFLDLQGEYVVVSFLAMEYHTLILNRSFAVMVTRNKICGAKILGTVGATGNALDADEWRDPRKVIDRKTYQKYRFVDPESPSFLKIDKDNFQIPTSSVAAIGFNSRKKLSMGGVPHSGSLFIHVRDGRKREFILLGEQDGTLVESLILGSCVSASRLPV
jgi:hypothetical protein